MDPIICNYCAECEQKIEDKHLLLAINRTWHEECLKCACCKCRLFEFSDRFYFRFGLLLCARDYIRLFGHSGYCQLCLRQISSNDWVMAIDGSSRRCWVDSGHPEEEESHPRLLAHLDCFACSKCKGRFCVGEPFYYQNGLIFCQRDFIGNSEGNEPKGN